jgi:hypothetical protein
MIFLVGLCAVSLILGQLPDDEPQFVKKLQRFERSWVRVLGRNQPVGGDQNAKHKALEKLGSLQYELHIRQSAKVMNVSSVLSPISPDHFLQKTYQRRALHIQRSSSSYRFQELFGLQTAEPFLRFHLKYHNNDIASYQRKGFVELWKDGNPVTLTTTDSKGFDQSVKSILSQLNEGQSIVLNGVHNSHSGLFGKFFMRYLGVILGSTCSIAYAFPRRTCPKVSAVLRASNAMQHIYDQPRTKTCKKWWGQEGWQDSSRGQGGQEGQREEQKERELLEDEEEEEDEDEPQENKQEP